MSYFSSTVEWLYRECLALSTNWQGFFCFFVFTELHLQTFRESFWENIHVCKFAIQICISGIIFLYIWIFPRNWYTWNWKNIFKILQFLLIHHWLKCRFSQIRKYFTAVRSIFLNIYINNNMPHWHLVKIFSPITLLSNIL